MQHKYIKKKKAPLNETSSETKQVEKKIKELQNSIHKMAANGIFDIFPFLPDNMEPEEMRYMGERVTCHLQELCNELTCMAYHVEDRTAKN
jgi:isocitrate dehydrogenase kinase/phosphatase